MGAVVSHASAAAPPPPPPGYAPTFADAASSAPPPLTPPGTGKDAAAVAEEEEEEGEKVDYMNLPCPVPYEDLQREAMMALRIDTFEGFRFDFIKGITPFFSLCHSVSMVSMELPSQGADVIKVPTSNYEFGANYLHPKMVLMGRVSHDGRLSARTKWDPSENLCVKINAQLTSEPHYSQGMLHCDYKGKDFRTQLQLGNGAYYGGNYIQSVTKNLSLGTEFFWIGQHRKSGVGFAARYDTKKMVATGQIATTGVVSLSYVQKVSEKVSLASDFMYNPMAKDVTASFGYDYMLRQCRLRGKIDTNGVVSALLEEHMAPGVNFNLSAEVDHWKKDYKFGFGMSIGE
uniref:Mitochondrial import receptor subunit TOM40-1 n=1 Tax=Leersia perrieri TaxID=77586 RepID=A0A0D9UZL6_9ORYZ